MIIVNSNVKEAIEYESEKEIYTLQVISLPVIFKAPYSGKDVLGSLKRR